MYRALNPLVILRLPTKLNLSARAYRRILKSGRTIADVAGSEDIQSAYLAGALHAPKSPDDHDGVTA